MSYCPEINLLLHVPQMPRRQVKGSFIPAASAAVSTNCFSSQTIVRSLTVNLTLYCVGASAVSLTRGARL